MKYTIQTKILAGFILGLMAISLIGYEVHNQMTNLASSLYKKNDEQNNLVIFQKVLSTLAETESSVRTFSITNNPDDLDLFYTSQDVLQKYLADLDESIVENKHFTNLNNHIDYKIYLMQRMIELKKRNPTEDLLDEALKEIDQVEEEELIPDDNQHPKEELSEEPEKEEQSVRKNNHPDTTPENKAQIDQANEDNDEERGFFHRLFSRKKGKEESEDTTNENAAKIVRTSKKLKAEDTTADVSKTEDDTKNNQQGGVIKQKNPNKAVIEHSLQKLKREKELEAEIWQEAMLILINEDARIMDKIRKEISALEKQEMNSNSQFIAAAARSKNRIINNTKIIAMGAFSIIFFLSLVVLNDFKKIRKNRQSLVDEKDKASRLAKVKEEFLANMSHEIRTPMNAIIGYSELLEKTHLDQQQADFLSTIQKSSGHLMVILNDILDYSKLESGKLVISKNRFSPEKDIEQVVKSMKRDEDKKNTALQIKIHRSVRGQVIGDSVRFQQILYNLVSNAIKFTDSGEVTIEAKGFDEAEGYLLQVEVKDTGIGIKKEHLAKIFENFEQLNTGRERKFGGTGLGLAIVKRLVDLQQGSIHVRSEEGKGSSFIIRIPYEEAEPAEKQEKNEKLQKANPVNFKNLSVLAVDDQEYNLELLKIILRKWGVNVDEATSGKAAVSLFHKKHYDLILMDVQMPQMSGLEATEQIRNSNKKEGETIPIIALTAASTKEETDKCLKAGMTDYLLKPFKQNDLQEMIIKQKYSAKNQIKPQRKKDVTFNLNHLNALSNGNDSFVLNMLEVFIKNTRKDLLKLEELIKEKDWRSAGLQAHKMVAPSRHLGIKSLVDLLENMERKGINEHEVEQLPELFQEIKHVASEATDLLLEEIEKINNKKIKQVS